jgi:hypothetical protein
MSDKSLVNKIYCGCSSCAAVAIKGGGGEEAKR